MTLGELGRRLERNFGPWQAVQTGAGLALIILGLQSL